MKHSLLETAIGAIVLMAAAIFLVFSYSSAHQGEGGLIDGSYRLSASFNNIGGLKTGDVVMISGVKVGTVDDIQLDNKLYRAVVYFSVTNDVDLSTDSSARIASESLLGGKYLDVQPGGDDTNLKNGDQISLTQGASNLEDLLGRFIFSGNQEKGSSAEKSPSPADTEDFPAHP
jgi:phospholipid/cholesterol/gamma-HCH transport system substrate-binding protein